jgi:hypothetical protein
MDAWIGIVDSLSSSLDRSLIRRGDRVAIRSGAGHFVGFELFAGGSRLFLVEIADVLAIVDPSAEVDGVVGSGSRSTTTEN